MIVQQIAEWEAALADGTVQNIKNLMVVHDVAKGALKEFMDCIKTIYNPDDDTWKPWCMTNLTSVEKNYVKTRYAGAKELYDTMVSG